MTLDEVIADLERAAGDVFVYIDFCSVAPTEIDSYRGSYDMPALGWAPTGHSGSHVAPTVDTLIRELKRALKKPYEGWKGGTYRFRGGETLYIDDPGDYSSTFVSRVRDDGWRVMLEIERED